jgi:hypothetical protein
MHGTREPLYKASDAQNSHGRTRDQERRRPVVPEQMQLFDPQTTLGVPRPLTDLRPDHRTAQLRPFAGRYVDALGFCPGFFGASLSIDLKDALWVRF